MNLEDALVIFLLSQANLNSLIQSRIYPEELPQQSALPAVTWIKVSDLKDHTLTGQEKTESPIYQFSALDLSKAGAKQVAAELKSALSDYQGSLSGVVIQKIELQNEISSMEKSSDGTVKVFYEDLEFQITFVKE